MMKWRWFAGAMLALMMLMAVACSSDDGATQGPVYDGDDASDGDNTSDGDEPADGDQPPACTPDATRCSGNDVQRCGYSAQAEAYDWQLYRNCQDSDQVCIERNGEAYCETPGQTDGDEPVDGDSLPDQCTSGDQTCQGNDVYQCRLDASGWDLLENCGVSQECVEGVCQTIVGDACTVADGCPANGEYCLPSTPGGTEGNCVPYCDTGNTRCPRGWECERGTCQPIEDYCISDADCEMDQFCNRLPNKPDGTCQRYCELPGENCPALYECVTNPDDINYGRCVLIDSTCEQCSYDEQCDAGNYCEKVAGQNVGCCKPTCSDDSECPGALVCATDGRCVVGSANQDCGGCPPGYICDRTFGQCVLNCPACGANECCDAESAPDCYTCECQNPPVCGLLLPPCCFGFSCSAIVYGVAGYCI